MKSIKYLLVLAADKDMEYAIKGILSQAQYSSINYEINVHPEHDPGCYKRAHEYFRPFLSSHSKALVVFDQEGCGSKKKTRVQIEGEVEEKLNANGWKNRSAAITIDPELETWIWSDSTVVHQALDWKIKETSLRNWLEYKNFSFQANGKPKRPKEAFLAVLRNTGISQSSSIFFEMGQKVSLERCVDPSFLKFKSKLQEWFPAKGKSSKA